VIFTVLGANAHNMVAPPAAAARADR
jgi:hypothetical protein